MDKGATMIDERTMDRWIDEHFNAYIGLLADYVAIPSIAKPGEDGFPYGKACADMLAFMERTMQRFGLKTDNVDTTVVIGTLEGSDTGLEGCRAIGIACHGDVVPATGAWERDPFTLWRNGDWLTGRGTTDNKGATIAVLFALAFLQDQGIRLRNDVKLYVGSAEEIGMPDMMYVREHRPLADFTLVPDAGFPVCYGEKGCIKFTASALTGDTNLTTFNSGTSEASVAASAVATISDIPNPMAVAVFLNEFPGIEASVLEIRNEVIVISSGRARHTAFPEGGIDAIGQLARALCSQSLMTGRAESLLRFIGEITSDFYGTGLDIETSDARSGKLTAVLTAIDLNDGKLTMRFNIRYPISADEKHIERTIRKRMETGGFSIEEFTLSPASVTEITPLINRLCDIANKIHGTDDPPYIMGGGTYARLMQPAIAYGMGTPSIDLAPPFPSGQGRAHQPNESVYIPRMKKGMKIYAQALLAIDHALSTGR